MRKRTKKAVETTCKPEAVELAHLFAVLEGLVQSKSGKFASAAEVEAAFRRFDI